MASMRTAKPALAFLLAALATAAFAADDDLARHRDLWSASGTSSYVYSYQKYCECHRDVPPETFVQVTAGTITDVWHVHADSDRRVPAREGSLDLYWTIEDLLGLIGTAAERGVTYRARYDSALGYPEAVYIDYDAAAVGEEIDIRLTSFEARD